MSWRDGRVYFFKGKQYWRLNRQLRVEKGYPRDIAHNWMHCRPQTPDATPSDGDTTSSATGTTLDTTSLAIGITLHTDRSAGDTILDITPLATASTALLFPGNVTHPEI